MGLGRRLSAEPVLARLASLRRRQAPAGAASKRQHGVYIGEGTRAQRAAAPSSLMQNLCDCVWLGMPGSRMLASADVGTPLQRPGSAGSLGADLVRDGSEE